MTNASQLILMIGTAIWQKVDHNQQTLPRIEFARKLDNIERIILNGWSETTTKDRATKEIASNGIVKATVLKKRHYLEH